jgi:hypothetical protein
MARIDCETRESALYSIAYFYNADPLEIDQFLIEIDIPEIDIPEIDIIDYDERCFLKRILYLFNQRFGEPIFEIDEVCWFHLTRTRQESTFEAGILPLNEAIDEIWSTLLSIFENTEHHLNLLKLKKNGVSDYHYNQKIKNCFDWGPFAMLIKDIAFCSDSDTVCNHNYLNLPEIIEDICNGYLNDFDVCLNNIIIESLKPCIVKFTSKKYIANDLFEIVLYYLLLTIREKGLNIYANTCFDSKGFKIPSESILKIDFL